MKKVMFCLSVLLSSSLFSLGQTITVLEGSLSPLKGQSSISLEFTYNNTGVGKFEKEADYIAQKKSDYNSKTPGRGDTWATAWEDDKQTRYKPRFVQMFNERGLQIKDGAAYTLIFNTTFMEPGFNAGWPIRKNASISGDAIIVETSNKNNVIAKISVKDAPGRAYAGADFDTGVRIQEAYAMAGRELGKFISSKIKK